MGDGVSMIAARVFVVGCPRSGTTLLQGMLASHPSIQSFPETHYFAKAYPRNALQRFLTVPTWSVRGYLPELLMELGREDLLPLAQLSPWDTAFQRPFLRILDAITLEAGRSLWVEKTPRHLHCIPQIAAR